MKAFLLFFPGLLITGSSLLAQDLHFSQFNENPALVNPALTGVAGTVRASLAYKEQWRKVSVPYSSYGVSVEARLKASNWEQVDDFRTKTYKKSYSRLAAGLSVYKNTSGDGRMSTTEANLSLSSNVALGRGHRLSLGLQGSIAQGRINYGDLLFPNQYNGSSYDPSMASHENFANQSFYYPDLGAGLLWNYGSEEKSISSNDNIAFELGTAVYHLNQPRLNYLGGSNERLASRYVLHGKMTKGLANSTMAIVPSFILQFQGPSNELVIGGMAKYFLKDASKYTGYVKRSSLGLGVYFRNRDALIGSCLLELGQFAAGFSYDFNVSRLVRASTARGGAEITLRYTGAAAFLYQKRG